ncbi:MAG: FMN-dependent NADH-azoreductase [Cyanobacteria bacterium J06626_4]
MTHVLHLDSSPRGDRSRSRQLAKQFMTAWQQQHPDDTVIYRDLRLCSIPYVTEQWIAADFTPPEARTSEMKQEIALSEKLVDEFLSVDRYVFSVPMYNFSVPASFKAYIDQIVRVGRTFAVVGDGDWQGLVDSKKALFITARGDDFRSGMPHADWDCQEPFLRTAFNFIGIADVQFVHANGLDSGAEARQRGLNAARLEIQDLAMNW